MSHVKVITMKGIFQDICNKASSDIARFELIKVEVEKLQGELSYRCNAEFFYNEAQRIFSKSYFQTIAQEFQIFIEQSIQEFNERATSSISIRNTTKHRHFTLNDISESLRVLLDQHNLVLAQAPHASGKTSKLALPLILNEQGKVVYTSHLRSIINSACERLKLISYLDATDDVKDHLSLGFKKEDAYQSFNSDRIKMAICLNSIVGVLDDLIENADLLVIDEFTQVLSSVAGSSLENFAHERIFYKLVNMIRKSKRVVVLDADMNDLAITFLEYCRPNEQIQIFNQPRLSNGINVDFCLCKGKLSAQNEILLRVIQDLHYGRRAAIATDSFQVSKDLKEQIESLYPNKKILLVNAKTTATEEVKNFQDNNRRSLERHSYNVLIFSPALTSGISIEKEHFDTGYGCFTGNSIISSDAIQMLRRVRNLKEYFVSVVAKNAGAIDSIKEREDGQKLRAEFCGDYKPIDDFTKFANVQKEARDWNLAHFPYALEKQLAEYGFDIEFCETGLKGNTPKGRDDKDFLNAVLHVDPITSDEYQTLKNQTEVSDTERAQILAFEVCDGFNLRHCDLTVPVLKLWDDGKGRYTVGIYHSLLSRQWVKNGFDEHSTPHVLRHNSHVRYIVFDILIALSGLEINKDGISGCIESDAEARLVSTMMMLKRCLAQIGIISTDHSKFNGSLTQIKNAFAKAGIFLKVKKVRIGNGERIRKLFIDEEMMLMIHKVSRQLY